LPEAIFLPGLNFGGAIAMTLCGILLLNYFTSNACFAKPAVRTNIIDNVLFRLQYSINQIFKQQKEEGATSSENNAHNKTEY